MPNLTITNLTPRPLPISTYFGSIDANDSKTKELSVEYLEAISTKLDQLETAGLISYTVAQEVGEDKITFAPASLKASMWYSGAGCPNGTTIAPQGAVYTNTVGGAAAAVGVGSITTIATAVILPGVDYFNVNDGLTGKGGEYIFQFTDATHPVSDVNYVPVVITGLVTSTEVRDAVINAINGTNIRVTASNGGAALVTVTQDDLGVIPGAAIPVDHVANAGFSVVDFVGATNSTLWVKEAGGVTAPTAFGWVGK